MKTHGTFKPVDGSAKPANGSAEEKTNHLSERVISEIHKLADSVHKRLVDRVLEAENELREMGTKEEEIPAILQQLYDAGLKAIEDNCNRAVEQAFKAIRERRQGNTK